MEPVLIIDTSKMGEVSVELVFGTQRFSEIKKQKFGSQALLELIIKVLKKADLDFKNLTGIEVETGPGSYTGLKVGVAVANALAYSLNIPVNRKKIETKINY